MSNRFGLIQTPKGNVPLHKVVVSWSGVRCDANGLEFLLNLSRVIPLVGQPKTKVMGLVYTRISLNPCLQSLLGLVQFTGNQSVVVRGNVEPLPFTNPIAQLVGLAN